MLLFQQRNAHSHTSFFNSSHIFDSLRSASMRLSDKRSLHPSIPHHTAAQPALEQNHTTVLRFHSSFWICWSELSKDASLAMNRCLHRSYQENDLHINRWTVNVSDYILLAILNIKPEFWPSAMSEECAESSYSSTSLFRIKLFFLYIAHSNPEDPMMRAMLELSVMNVEKEIIMVKERRKEKQQRGWSPSLNRWCVLEDVQSLPPSGNW